jgi:DNA-directed RNA polymerase subunit L
MAYTIKPLVWLVQDQESVKFHVKNDDYFGTMATLLNLLKQEIYKNNKSEAKVKATFANMEKDFMWLQKNYKIIKK